MGTVTHEDLHVDRMLSNLAIGYFEGGRIAAMIAPIVQVANKSDLFPVWSRADALRAENDLRAPDTEANKITMGYSTDTYLARNYALKSAITIEDRANADPVFVQGIINGRTRAVTNKLSMRWEIRVAGIVNSTSNVGSSAGVSSEWDASASSDPIGDIQTAMDNVQDLTGTRPNRATMGLDAWRSLRRNDQILDRIFGSTRAQGNPTIQQVAGLLELDEILVGAAYRNTAEEPQAESLAKIWGDNVTVYYAPSAPSIEEPSFMYSFRWNAPGLPNMQVERHPFDPKRKSEEIEVGYYQDEKVTAEEYAFTLLSVNSST